jgi:predicted amino acid racemase
MRYPAVSWNKEKLIHNADKLSNIVKERNIDLIPVTKAIGANIEIIKTLYNEGIYQQFADSRLLNLRRIKYNIPGCRTMLLRLPSLYEVEEIIEWVDCSLVSEGKTIISLNEEAKRQNKTHEIILMIELGDLREGILKEEIVEMGRLITHCSNIRWSGIGGNLTCVGGVIPTHENLAPLLELKQMIENEFLIKLDIVSGGNSSSLPLVISKEIPSGINQLRIGEALFLGRETAYGTKLPSLYDDIFVLHADVIEVKHKPSIPKGIIGKNAFGEDPIFIDRGIRRRAILAIGEQDVSINELVPITQGIEILGASSDHLVIDVTDAKKHIDVGSVISFKMNYKALLQTMTSMYVTKFNE